MIYLHEYAQDGAGHSARAVLAYLQMTFGDGIEESWNSEHKCYKAIPRIGRWENCREQGYVIRMRGKTANRQINIAWFEHRNSDEICAIIWEQSTINSPTIDTAEFGDVYKDKYDISHSVKWDRAADMAKWISDELNRHWLCPKNVAA